MCPEHPVGAGRELTFPLSRGVNRGSFLWVSAGFHFIPPNLLRSNSFSCLARAEQQTEKQWEETSGLVEGCVLERLHKPHFFRKPG